MTSRLGCPVNHADRVSVDSDVSVIVCTHSVERWPWLLKCLASLRTQTLEPFEVIVVVNGSADLDGRLRKRHGPERLLYTSAPLGLSAARSLGLTAATGAFVCFLEDDAVADPNCLSILRSSMSDGAVGWASGCSLPMWNGATPRWMPQELEWTLGNDYRSIASAQTDAENMDSGCVCMRREFFVLFAGLGANFERSPRGLDGIEATELYSSIQDRMSALRLIHEPTAIIRQPVPDERQRPAYVLARCWEEGVSNAMRAVTQFRPSLVGEHERCHGTVPTRLGSYLRQALLGDMAALQKAGILYAAPAITLAGHASGSVRRFAKFGRSEKVATTTTLDDARPREAPPSGLEATESGTPPPRRPWWDLSAAGSRAGVVAMLTAVGLLVVAVGYAIGWAGNDGLSVPVFYIGISAIFVPCAWRLLGRAAHRKERLQVAVILGLFLMLAFYLSSPLLFDRYDDLIHATTLWQLSDQHQLFTVNTTLPISPYYPGLELLTLGVHWSMGLPAVASELLAVAASRVVLVLSIFLIVERLTRSSFAGGVAVLAYATSTQFFAFNAQFAYQTLALGLALATVHFLLVSIDRPAPKVDRNLVLAVVCVATLTVTHHVVSWLTVLWLIVWAISLLMARRIGAARVVGWAAGIGVALVAVWTAGVVGPQLVDYLAPPFHEGIANLAAVLRGATSGRQLFTDPTGVVEPIWERLIEIGSVIAWGLMLIPAIWTALKRRSLRGRSLAFIPLAVAVTFPAVVVAHLAPEPGAQIAERASTFVFVGMAIVISAWLSVIKRRWRFGIPVLIALVCFLGGQMIGSGPLWSATPGPYLVAADQRSVDAASIAAAQWARGHLPANSHMAADAVNSVLMAAVGHMSPVNDVSGQVNVGPIYFDQTFTQHDLSLIRGARIRYFVVDDRLTESLPHVGVYFASGETPTPQRLTGAELAKFQAFPGLVRIYDNGPIQIYDASALLGIPSVRGDPGTSGAPLQDGADPFVLVLATILVAIWARVLISRRPTSESLLRGTVIAMTAAIAATMILVPTGLPAEPIVIVLLALGVVFALPAIAMDSRPIKPKRFKTAAALVVGVAITGLSVAIAIGAENIAWQAPAQLSIQRDSTGGWEAAVSLGSGVAAHPRLELTTDLGNMVWSSALASGASVQHVVLPPNLVTKSQAVVLTIGGHRVLSVAT
jgi:hypothetical protein